MIAYSNINELIHSREFGGILSYLSLVNGIEGAILYDRDGLVVASGENTDSQLHYQAPYLLADFMSSLAKLEQTDFGRIDVQVTYGSENFFQIVNLNKASLFFLVVSGPKGSYELFKIRIGRSAQALEYLIHEKGYYKG